MADEKQNNGQNRESHRVEVSFPLFFVPLKGTRVEGEKRRILAHSTQEREGDLALLLEDKDLEKADPALLKLWAALDRKLDYVINVIKEKEGGGSPSKIEGECYNISENGLNIISREGLPREEWLRIEILPPTFPPLSITVLGRIVRTEKSSLCQEGEAAYGIEFEAINERDRDRLVKYIFKRQREIIRTR